MAIETLYATTVLTNNGCLTPENALGPVNDVWTTNTLQESWDCLWALGATANPLSAGATHTVTVRVRRSAAGGTDPSLTAVELWRAGVLFSTIATPGVVTDAVGQDFVATFTTDELGGNAADLQIHLVATGGAGATQNRRNIQVDAMTFEAETSAASEQKSASFLLSHTQSVALTAVPAVPALLLLSHAQSVSASVSPGVAASLSLTSTQSVALASTKAEEGGVHATLILPHTHSVALTATLESDWSDPVEPVDSGVSASIAISHAQSVALSVTTQVGVAVQASTISSVSASVAKSVGFAGAFDIASAVALSSSSSGQTSASISMSHAAAVSVASTKLVGVGGYPSAILADSPIAYWRLGEASGTAAVAVVGSDGVYVGSPTFGVSGAVRDSDTAIDLSSINDHVNTGTPLLPLSGSAPFSIEVWTLKTPDRLADGDSLIGQYPGSSSSDPARFGLRIRNDGRVWYWHGSWADFSGTTSIADGEFHHIVVTRDGSSNVQIYVDGLAEGVLTSDVGPFLNTETRIGQFGDGHSLGYRGVVDEPAVYDYALTPGQVADHYSAAVYGTLSSNNVCTVAVDFSSSVSASLEASHATSSTLSSAKRIGFAGVMESVQSVSIAYDTAESVGASLTINHTQNVSMVALKTVHRAALFEVASTTAVSGAYTVPGSFEIVADSTVAQSSSKSVAISRTAMHSQHLTLDYTVTGDSAGSFLFSTAVFIETQQSTQRSAALSITEPHAAVFAGAKRISISLSISQANSVSVSGTPTEQVAASLSIAHTQAAVLASTSRKTVALSTTNTGTVVMQTGRYAAFVLSVPVSSAVQVAPSSTVPVALSSSSATSLDLVSSIDKHASPVFGLQHSVSLRVLRFAPTVLLSVRGTYRIQYSMDAVYRTTLSISPSMQVPLAVSTTNRAALQASLTHRRMNDISITHR